MYFKRVRVLDQRDVGPDRLLESNQEIINELIRRAPKDPSLAYPHLAHLRFADDRAGLMVIRMAEVVFHLQLTASLVY